jgi:hypothetical protein
MVKYLSFHNFSFCFQGHNVTYPLLVPAKQKETTKLVHLNNTNIHKVSHHQGNMCSCHDSSPLSSSTLNGCVVSVWQITFYGKIIIRKSGSWFFGQNFGFATRKFSQGVQSIWIFLMWCVFASAEKHTRLMCWHAKSDLGAKGCSSNGLEMRRNMLCEDVCKVFEIVNASVLEVQKTHLIDVLACIRSWTKSARPPPQWG